MSCGSAWEKSATWDEPIHLALGYAALTRGDYRLDPEHPPLVRLWAALPLLAISGITLDTSFVDRCEPSAYARTVAPVPQKFLYFDNDGDRLLRAGRLMTSLLGAGLGVLLFLWAYEWLGWWPAVLAMVFFAIEPNLLSHASLVTTDAGFTAFWFGTVYFLWRAHHRRGRRDLIWAAAFFTAAVLSKFSALILAPIVAVVLIAIAWQAKGRRVLTAAGLIAAFAVLAWTGVWASYRFRYMPSASDSWRYHFQDDEQVRSTEPQLTAVADWIDRNRLLPNAYVQGFLFSRVKAETRPAFLAGDYSTHGWWYYFPFAFLIKTPISLLMLIIIGVVAAIRRMHALGMTTLAFVIAPPLFYLGIAMAAPINIGLRHILPVYPFAILLGAAGAATLAESLGSRGRLLLFALVLLGVVELASVYPHTLTFFNIAVAGPSHGEKYLVDSNLDWGQDLKPLKQWMDQRGIPYINLAYFGTADPSYYHIQRTDLPGSDFFLPSAATPPHLPGYVAVSATVLNGVYFEESTRRFYEPLRSLSPITTIGNSIHVYWVERPWW